MDCCQYVNLSPQSRLHKILAFRHTENAVALSYITKTKIELGEIAQRQFCSCNENF